MRIRGTSALTFARLVERHSSIYCLFLHFPGFVLRVRLNHTSFNHTFCRFFFVKRGFRGSCTVCWTRRRKQTRALRFIKASYPRNFLREDSWMMSSWQQEQNRSRSFRLICNAESRTNGDKKQQNPTPEFKQKLQTYLQC